MPKPRYKAWYGGKCPVSEGTTISVLQRCGVTYRYTTAGIDWCWIHLGRDDDIVAYRVVNACNP